jgi:hypothetical protein
MSNEESEGNEGKKVKTFHGTVAECGTIATYGYI